MALVVSLSRAASGAVQGDSKPSLSLALLPVWVPLFHGGALMKPCVELGGTGIELPPVTSSHESGKGAGL